MQQMGVKTVSVGKKENQKITFYDVILEDEKQLALFCSDLAYLIINRYEFKIISHILETNYCYFDGAEKREILSYMKTILNDQEIRKKLQDMIAESVRDYLDTCNLLIIEGFLMFRLEAYMIELELILEEAVQYFIAQKEYDEFIELLRFFVDTQEPAVRTIHVRKRLEGYEILDEAYQIIEDDCIDDFLNEMKHGTINYDDLLLSTLITLAPETIYIHNCSQIENKELIKTLKKVFEERLHLCKQCDFCRNTFENSISEKKRHLSNIKSDLYNLDI